MTVTPGDSKSVFEHPVCILHMTMSKWVVRCVAELLSQLSSVRSRALGGPHSLSSHFSQLEMQLASSRFDIELHQISALANPESGNFSEIRPSLALAKFLARFGGCLCSCSIYG